MSKRSISTNLDSTTDVASVDSTMFSSRHAHNPEPKENPACNYVSVGGVRVRSTHKHDLFRQDNLLWRGFACCDHAPSESTSFLCLSGGTSRLLYVLVPYRVHTEYILHQWSIKRTQLEFSADVRRTRRRVFIFSFHSNFKECGAQIVYSTHAATR